MVAAYSVRDECRRHQHRLHQSALGYQDPIHGTFTGTCVYACSLAVQTQSRDEVRYKHTLDAALTIYRTEGLSAFYRGLLPSLLGITHVAVQFPLYEQLKVWAQDGNEEPISSRVILLCSAAAKMTASIATYPHEVVRTRLQTQRRPLADDYSSDGMVKKYPRSGIIYTIKKLIRKEGWTGLYKGLSVNLIRTVPNSAVTMLTYAVLSSPNSSVDLLLPLGTSS